MDGRTDISIERIQMNLEVEHIVRQRRWLEVWPESHCPGFVLRHADVLQSYTA